MLTEKSKLHQSDLELVKRFIEDDQSAQDSLQTIVNDLMDRAFNALASKGSHFRDPKNVRQEIIVSVLLDDEHAVLKNFNGQSRLATYLWSVIRFRLIDALRKEMLDSRRKGKIPENISYKPDQSSEIFDLIGSFLNRLPEKDAFILEKRWLQQLSYEEICVEAAEQNFEIDKTYIGNFLFKARQKLIPYLKNHGYDFDK